MKIVNAVFSKQNGGLEQASIDYTKAFKYLGWDIAFLTSTRAPYWQEAENAGAKATRIPNFMGYWDFLAIFLIRRWLKKHKVDAIIAHGNRAISLLRKAANNGAPVICVNHTESVKRSVGAKNIITVNTEQKNKILSYGHQDAAAIHVVPNMVIVSEEQRIYQPKPFQAPPVIGVMARLWPTKGVDIFIKALGILQRQGVAFKARIGGSGPEKEALELLIKQEDLTEKVELSGWITDRNEFYRSMDVFCLPSRQETFGIVVLEAFQYKLPVVASAVSGPVELSDNRNVIQFVPPDNPESLANALKQVIENEVDAKLMAAEGFTLLEERYRLETVAMRLKAIIEGVCHNEGAGTN